jgi:hypothetical protein
LCVWKLDWAYGGSRSLGTGRRICHPPEPPIHPLARGTLRQGGQRGEIYAMVTSNTVLGSCSELVNIDMVCELSAAFAVFVCESMKKTSGDGKKVVQKICEFLYFFFLSRAWLFGFVFFHRHHTARFKSCCCAAESFFCVPREVFSGRRETLIHFMGDNLVQQPVLPRRVRASLPTRILTDFMYASVPRRGGNWVSALVASVKDQTAASPDLTKPQTPRN